MPNTFKAAAAQLSPIFLDAEEGILYADIDLQQIIAAKRMFDVTGYYSRPDLFNFSVSE